MAKKTEQKKQAPAEQKKESKTKDISYEATAMDEAKVRPRAERIAVAHVFSSKNDTIITLTDMSGAETIAVGSGGMVVSADSQEGLTGRACS